jgi:hypothetical protein
MISGIVFIVVIILVAIPLYQSVENDKNYHWIWWLLLNIFWIIPIFTGVNIKNNEGQYKGYITSVERNGVIFVGYNAYLKTDLTSSNEDKACIDRENKELIERLKVAQEKKENITVGYEGVWQYGLGECPNADWKIIKIID